MSACNHANHAEFQFGNKFPLPLATHQERLKTTRKRNRLPSWPGKSEALAGNPDRILRLGTTQARAHTIVSG